MNTRFNAAMAFKAQKFAAATHAQIMVLKGYTLRDKRNNTAGYNAAVQDAWHMIDRFDAEYCKGFSRRESPADVAMKIWVLSLE